MTSLNWAMAICKNCTRTLGIYRNEPNAPRTQFWMSSQLSKSTWTVHSPETYELTIKKMQVVVALLFLLVLLFVCLSASPSTWLLLLWQAQAGVRYFILHGCVKCNKFVYVPSDKRATCPYAKPNGEVCGAARYDEDGKPREVNKQTITILTLDY